MHRSSLIVLLGLVSCQHPAPTAPSPSAVTILAINDTYNIEGAGGLGGMARVRTLRAQLEAAGGPVILTHAGDMLSPSFLSRTYDGAQMIDVLNQLDGDAEAADPRMVVVPGNHELEAGRLSDAATLDARIEQSGFTWVSADIAWTAGEDGAALVGADNLVHDTIIEAGGLKVGFFGLTIANEHPAYVDGFADPIETARAETAALRGRGAQVVVGLTHQTMAQDKALLSALGADGPDLLLGGHEHDAQEAEIDGRAVLKADAEALSAQVVTLSLSPEAGLQIAHRLVPLDASVPEDPTVAARVEGWLQRHEQEWCAAASLEDGCLSVPLGKSNTVVDADELTIRRFETGIGNWAADLMLSAMADEGAQIAFVNSGGLRLNQRLPAGTLLTRRHVEQLLPYPTDLRLIEISGATLSAVLARSITDWTGNGQWLQVAGFAFRHDPDAGTATDLTFLGPDGARPIQPTDRLKAVTADYVAKGGDGYTMFPGEATALGSGPALKTLVMEAITAAGEAGISPAVEGRICNPQRPGTCLALPAAE